jgi:flagellar FliL protein
MAAANDKEATTPAKGSSLVVQLGVLAVLTAAAVGTGWLVGGHLRAEADTHQAAAANEKADAGHAAAQRHDGGQGHGAADADGETPPLYANPTIVDLLPVTTNLAAPSDTWVRAELAVHFTRAPQPGVADAIHQDMLGYLRTVKLHQIEGPSGFQHLKADLLERANMISKGEVKEVLVRTLLFE